MKIFSPTISGSSQTSGSLTISGSLNVSQGITGSLFGTASWAINVVNGGGGGSTNTGSLLTTASVVLNTITFTKGDGSTFPITVNTGSGGGGSVGTLAQVTALGASTTVPITASIISASSFTGSLFGTASWAQSASNAINARTASFVNNLNQDLSITGAVILSGSSLPELRVIGETQFTGSVNSFNGYTGSLLGTSSWATNALTASFLPVGTYSITSSWAQSTSNAINARTASFLPVGIYSITSSWATNALTASLAPSYVLTSVTSSMLTPYVLTSVTSSMLAPYTLNSQTSSFVRNTQTSSMTVLSSSFAATASFAPSYLLVSQTSSFVQNSQTSSMLAPYVLNSQTSSFVQNSQTSSFVQNSQTSSMLASYVLTSVTSSMLSPYLLVSQTSSFVQNSQTGSMLAPYVLTSVTSSMLAPYTLNSQTSSFVRNTQTSSMTVLSSSFTATASFINNLNQNLSITGAVILSGSSLPELRVIGETQFTGSVNSFNGYTGSLFGTASQALNVVGGGGGGVTINNNVDNYLVTATGTANTLDGESTLTFDGTTLTVGGNISAVAIDTRNDPSTTIGDYAVGSHIARDWVIAGNPALTAGNIVYFSGSSHWANAQANATGSSTRVLGVVTSNIDPNEIVLQGTVTVNTDLATYQIGQPVYLSPLTAGRVTNIPPSSSGHVARYVGWVVDTNRDQIYFNPDFTYIQL